MPVNVQLTKGNFSFGPETGFFYSLDDTLQLLKQVEADSTVVATFPLAGSTIRTLVKQLHFDGTNFWTMEDLPSDLGMVIKQWRLSPVKTFSSPNAVATELRWQNEITLINATNIRWVAQGFAVEHYHRQLDGSFLRGSSSIKLNSVANVVVGDTLYLGPSTFGGFVDFEEKVVVASVNQTTRVITFTKAGGLENSYTSTNPVNFVRSVYVFNDHSFSGNEDNRGNLVRFSWPQKAVILTAQGFSFHDVNAADFDSTFLCWVKGSQIFQLNVAAVAFSIFSSLEANIIDADLNTLLVVDDLIADLGSSLFYKLQQKETTESVATGVFTTTDFSPKFNFQTQTTAPIVNSTALSFPDTRFTLPFSSGEKIAIRAEVRDQFNFPVLGKTVQFSAALNPISPAGAVGSFSPATAITNASGIVNTLYTPSSSTENLLIDVQAKVL